MSREVVEDGSYAVSEFGRIDILLANAGITANSPIAQMSVQQ